jgi:peptidoglycan/LPS O-acetylase OafA/YrhL
MRRRVELDLFTRPPGSLPALDGMRAFACAAIVFFHCTLFSRVFEFPDLDFEMDALRYAGNALWTGVDIFFVLSGFLIGRILLADLVDDGSLRFGRFYARRSFRIFPAYYLVLVTALFVLAPFNIAHFGSYLAFTGAQDFEALRAGAWPNFVYLNNYAAPSGGDVMTWGWSLCVEEHFYLLLPTLLALIFLVRSPALRAALLVACTLLPLAARAAIYASGRGADHAFYYTSHTRFDQLFVGVLIAYAYVVYRVPFQRFVERTGPLSAAIGLAGILLVWTYGGLLGTGAFAIVWQFFVLALGVGFVLVSALFLDNPLTRFFAHPYWYPLARVSYGIYLVHPIVIFGCMPWFQAVLPNHPVRTPKVLGLYACAMAISFLVASTMFLLIERPLLDLGGRLGGRTQRGRA